MKIITEIINGAELNQSDLDLINEYRRIRLGRDTTWDHDKNNHFHDRTFFLVREEGNLVAFGTLRNIKLFIEKKEIEVMGIQAIISIIQGKGFGKVLMKSMIKYAEENKLILVGFCDHKNAGFYIKSGLEVFENKNTSFIFIQENGEEYTEDGDVIYFSASDSQVKDALMNGKKIKHFIPHW